MGVNIRGGVVVVLVCEKELVVVDILFSSKRKEQDLFPSYAFASQITRRITIKRRTRERPAAVTKRMIQTR